MELFVVAEVEVDDNAGIGIGLLRLPPGFPRLTTCATPGFADDVAVLAVILVAVRGIFRFDDVGGGGCPIVLLPPTTGMDVAVADFRFRDATVDDDFVTVGTGSMVLKLLQRTQTGFQLHRSVSG